jgi:hypothetical protein
VEEAGIDGLVNKTNSAKNKSLANWGKLKLEQ